MLKDNRLDIRADDLDTVVAPSLDNMLRENSVGQPKNMPLRRC